MAGFSFPTVFTFAEKVVDEVATRPAVVARILIAVINI